jgi:hypothetical protein
MLCESPRLYEESADRPADGAMAEDQTRHSWRRDRACWDSTVAHAYLRYLVQTLGRSGDSLQLSCLARFRRVCVPGGFLRSRAWFLQKVGSRA